MKKLDYIITKDGRTFPGKVEKIKGKYVGAVAYSSRVNDYIPLAIMPSPDPSESRFIRTRKSFLSLQERACLMLKGEEEYSHLAIPQESRSYE